MHQSDCLDVISYHAGLLKCRSVLEKAVDPALREPYQPPVFTTLCFKLAFPLPTDSQAL